MLNLKPNKYIKIFFVFLIFSTLSLQTLQPNFAFIPEQLKKVMKLLSSYGVHGGVSMFSHQPMHSYQLDKCLALVDSKNKTLWKSPECKTASFILLPDTLNSKFNLLLYHLSSPYWFWIGHFNMDKPGSRFFENYFKDEGFFVEPLESRLKSSQKKRLDNLHRRNIKIVRSLSTHYCKKNKTKSIHGLIHLKFYMRAKSKIIEDSQNLFQFDCEDQRIAPNTWEDKTFLVRRIFPHV